MSLKLKQSVFAAAGFIALAAVSGVASAQCAVSAANRPVCPAGAQPTSASFTDPSASIAAGSQVNLGQRTYLGPFVDITAQGVVNIGDRTDLQDNVRVDGVGNVDLGDDVIIAHGARVSAPAVIGRKAVAGAHNASFVGFNSHVNGAIIEHDAMVLHLARVKPGIRIKSGKVVLSGKSINSQKQANQVSLGKVVPITDALRAFMDGVLHVNTVFASEYTRLHISGGNARVSGANVDPGFSDFNPNRDIPVFAGVQARSPRYRNRIVGMVEMADSLDTLNVSPGKMGNKVSLRADEGEHFKIGSITYMADHTTFHALEHTGIEARNNVTYGLRSVVHGGKSEATVNNAHYSTVIGEGTQIGNHAVLFRSVTGKNVKIGCGSLVDGSTLPDSFVVPMRTIVINHGHSNPSTYRVEWNPGC